MMRGHVREVRLGVWRIMWDLPADPLTGRRRLRSATVHGPREEAERQLAVIVGRIAEGRWADPKQLTVEELAADWLDTVAHTVRPVTLTYYREKLRCACQLIGRQRIDRITGRMLTDLYRRMLGQYAPQTVTHVHRTLHRMFSDAVRWQLLDRNPCEQASAPRTSKRRLDVWTADQVRRFLQLAVEHRCVALFRLAATTGMRRSELCGLKWPQVNLERGYLDVVAGRVVVAGRPQLSEPKTQSGRRRLSLDAESISHLVRLQAEQTEHRDYWQDTYDDGSWVFCWEDGRPWSPDWVSRQFQKLIAGTDLPRIRFHDLRHTWATLALEAGVPAKVVADRLGHSTIVITLDVYTHHLEKLDRAAADQVANLFGPDRQ